MLLVIPVLFMSSCNKTDLSPLDADSAMIDLAFYATTDDSTGVLRDHHGKCKLTEVNVEELSQTIKDYISANYPDATIERAGSNEGNGVIIVGIKKADGTFAGLMFDAQGNFLKEKTRRHKGTPVAEVDLPSNIKDYLAANYTGASIHRAFKGEEGKYLVLLTLADESFLGVGFDENGEFISEFNMKNKEGHMHGPKGWHGPGKKKGKGGK